MLGCLFQAIHLRENKIAVPSADRVSPMGLLWVIYSRTPLSYFCNASIPERLRESYYQYHQVMIDKRGESNIRTNVMKKAAVLSHMGSRTAACLLMLYSFLASVFKSHQSARVLCCISEMSPLAWKNRFSEKLVFPNFSAREKPVKVQKHRTFVRCFLCCIFHQHILVRVARLELRKPEIRACCPLFFCVDM